MRAGLQELECRVRLGELWIWNPWCIYVIAHRRHDPPSLKVTLCGQTFGMNGSLMNTSTISFRMFEEEPDPKSGWKNINVCHVCLRGVRCTS